MRKISRLVKAAELTSYTVYKPVGDSYEPDGYAQEGSEFNTRQDPGSSAFIDELKSKYSHILTESADWYMTEREARDVLVVAMDGEIKMMLVP